VLRCAGRFSTTHCVRMTLMSVYTQGDVEEGCTSLKPDVRAFLDGSAALLSFPPEAEHDEAAGREHLRRMRSLGPPAREKEPLEVVRDELADEVLVRVYVPQGEGLRRIVVRSHGGGWVTGDLEMHDATCRRIGQSCEVQRGQRRQPTRSRACVPCAAGRLLRSHALGGRARR
jgi:acetyl esterase/lipase